jgi:hypothetical protein
MAPRRRAADRSAVACGRVGVPGGGRRPRVRAARLRVALPFRSRRTTPVNARPALTPQTPARPRRERVSRKDCPMRTFPAVAHVAVTVHDLSTSVPWYSELFGASSPCPTKTPAHSATWCSRSATACCLDCTSSLTPTRRAASTHAAWASTASRSPAPTTAWPSSFFACAGRDLSPSQRLGTPPAAARSRPRRRWR